MKTLFKNMHFYSLFSVFLIGIFYASFSWSTLYVSSNWKFKSNRIFSRWQWSNDFQTLPVNLKWKIPTGGLGYVSLDPRNCLRIPFQSNCYYPNRCPGGTESGYFKTKSGGGTLTVHFTYVHGVFVSCDIQE